MIQGLACAILAGNAFDAGYVKHLLIGGTVLFAARSVSILALAAFSC